MQCVGIATIQSTSLPPGNSTRQLTEQRRAAPIPAPFLPRSHGSQHRWRNDEHCEQCPRDGNPNKVLAEMDRTATSQECDRQLRYLRRIPAPLAAQQRYQLRDDEEQDRVNKETLTHGAGKRLRENRYLIPNLQEIVETLDLFDVHRHTAMRPGNVRTRTVQAHLATEGGFPRRTFFPGDRVANLLM